MPELRRKLQKEQSGSEPAFQAVFPRIKRFLQGDDHLMQLTEQIISGKNRKAAFTQTPKLSGGLQHPERLTIPRRAQVDFKVQHPTRRPPFDGKAVRDPAVQKYIPAPEADISYIRRLAPL